mmetsp:Transcript_37047/g.92910  ORF Transcript_37047/g.92910 Transcript_37047/m.92910 type:complete len:260 (-) Transcript_37047:865-1644(-)
MSHRNRRRRQLMICTNNGGGVVHVHHSPHSSQLTHMLRSRTGLVLVRCTIWCSGSAVPAASGSGSMLPSWPMSNGRSDGTAEHRGGMWLRWLLRRPEGITGRSGGGEAAVLADRADKVQHILSERSNGLGKSSLIGRMRRVDASGGGGLGVAEEEGRESREGDWRMDLGWGKGLRGMLLLCGLNGEALWKTRPCKARVLAGAGDGGVLRGVYVSWQGMACSPVGCDLATAAAGRRIHALCSESADSDLQGRGLALGAGE